MIVLVPDIIPIIYWLAFLFVGLHIFWQGIRENKGEDKFYLFFMSVGMVYAALNFLAHYAMKIKETLLP